MFLPGERTQQAGACAIFSSDVFSPEEVRADTEIEKIREEDEGAENGCYGDSYRCCCGEMMSVGDWLKGGGGRGDGRRRQGRGGGG